MSHSTAAVSRAMLHCRPISPVTNSARKSGRSSKRPNKSTRTETNCTTRRTAATNFPRISVIPTTAWNGLRRPSTNWTIGNRRRKTSKPKRSANARRKRMRWPRRNTAGNRSTPTRSGFPRTQRPTSRIPRAGS